MRATDSERARQKWTDRLRAETEKTDRNGNMAGHIEGQEMRQSEGQGENRTLLGKKTNSETCR